MFHEVELGATNEEVASALGIQIDWVRERVEAARLCFSRQVQVVASEERSEAFFNNEAA